MTALDPEVQAQSFVHEWEDWHRSHEKFLADPHGFLAITNIHWLDATPRRFPDAPGAWETTSEGVTVTLGEGEEIVVGGVTRRGRHDFGVIPERGSVMARWEDKAVEVAKRGGYDMIRPRHPNNPLVAGFHGTPAFRADPRWVLTGRYVPFPEPRPTTVGAAVEGLEHVYVAPGRIEFEIDGETYSLTAFPRKDGGDLMVLFTDATSGITTYAANRSVVVSAPDEEGRVTLDFNRAVNLPCAYTDLATCPLPPSENRLAVAIEAGEQIPYERRDPASEQVRPPPLP
jgi:uncharacterized protein (DUF1684 family)